MSELSIKVIIAGRTYPLTIQMEEEEAVRAAANRINDAVKVLRDNYAVKDTQDLLAMAALQLVIQGNPTTSESLQDDPAVESILNSISQSLSTALD